MKPLKSKSKKNLSSASLSIKLVSLLKRFSIFFLPYILSLSLIALIVVGVFVYALNSSTFELAEVKILNAGTLTPKESFAFCDLKPGENLIRLNLVNVQQVIKANHPEFKEVKVSRVLPNRIEVRLKRRTPVAQIAYSRFVQIDRDLIILPGSNQFPFKNLTVIQGAALPKEGLVVGAVVRDVMTDRAVKLVDIVRRSNVLKNHELSKIDITDNKNVVLVVDGVIEIRMGDNHFIERLKILDQTLKTIELDPSKISYLDLRFDDVILGQRGLTVEPR